MQNISEEDKKYLLELSKKMNSQDNRATQFPMFVIKQKVKVYGREECCDELERKEEQDDDEMCETCSEKYEEGTDLLDNCQDCDPRCFIEFNWEDETVEDAGSFFTAEAAQDHIDRNAYHYNKPFTYGIPSWRNPEMQIVLKIISSLETGEARSCYK